MTLARSLSLLLFLVLSPLVAVNAQAKAVPFVGIGAQWDSYNYVKADLSEAEFDLISRRLVFMRPGLVRVMMQTKWCYTNGVYDWDSPSMRQLYRILDRCQALGITVFLNDWGCGTPGHPERDWLKTPGISGPADPVYAEVMVRYLEHLVGTKNYDTIRFFAMGNEPNLEIPDWAMWKTGIVNLRNELKRKPGLSGVLLTGSDESGGNAWHQRTVDELGGRFDAYDFHGYPDDKIVKDGRLRALIHDKLQYILDHDPRGAEKPTLIGEVGVTPLDRMDDYLYGVQMADYAVQAMNAGVSGFSAWLLDDNSYPGFNNGLWKDRAHGFALRPWFYPWSLLCRTFPPGSQIAEAGEASPVLRSTMAALPDGGLSVVAVNRGTKTLELPLDLGEQPHRLYLYRYQENSRPTDAQGFPQPVEVVNLLENERFHLTIPANAVVFLTTLAP